MASSLDELSLRTRDGRSALWSGLQLCSVDMPRRCMVQASKMAAVNVSKNKVEKIAKKKAVAGVEGGMSHEGGVIIGGCVEEEDDDDGDSSMDESADEE